MKFFDKVQVKWREPEAFLLKRDVLFQKVMDRYGWMRPAMLLASALILNLDWGLRVFFLHSSETIYPLRLPLALCGLAVLVYGLPWVFRQMPSTVVLYARSIAKMGESDSVALCQTRGFYWSPEGHLHVLSLILKNGRCKSYGVPDSATRDKIDTTLREAGLVEIKPDVSV